MAREPETVNWYRLEVPDGCGRRHHIWAPKSNQKDFTASPVWDEWLDLAGSGVHLFSLLVPPAAKNPQAYEENLWCGAREDGVQCHVS